MIFRINNKITKLLLLQWLNKNSKFYDDMNRKQQSFLISDKLLWKLVFMNMISLIIHINIKFYVVLNQEKMINKKGIKFKITLLFHTTFHGKIRQYKYNVLFNVANIPTCFNICKCSTFLWHNRWNDYVALENHLRVTFISFVWSIFNRFFVALLNFHIH